MCLNLEGSYLATFTSDVIWDNSFSGTINQKGYHIVSFLSDDGGVTWYGKYFGRFKNYNSITKMFTNLFSMIFLGFLNSKGDLYVAGSNSKNFFGNKEVTGYDTFTKIASNVVDFKNCFLAGLGSDAGYITKNKELYLCGSNNYGEIGSGDFNEVETFVKVADNVKDFIICDYITWYLTENNELYCSGNNNYGQQGIGASNFRVKTNTFAKVAENVKEILTPHAFSYPTFHYMSLDDCVYCTGSIERGAGVQYGNYNHVVEFTKSIENLNKLYLTAQVTAYINTANNFYMAGYNNYGQQGDGTTTAVKCYTQRASNVKEARISSDTSWYLTLDGDLYGCGKNNYGQQGSGTSGSSAYVTSFTKRASNVKTITYSNSRIDTSYNDEISWYIDNNDDLYLCGMGTSGLQASGELSNVTSFTKRASNVAKFYLFAPSAFYITNDNVLYGFGKNQYGEVDTTNNKQIVTSPIKILEGVKHVIHATDVLIVEMLDGEILGRGANTVYELGIGEIQPVNDFVIIG